MNAVLLHYASGSATADWIRTARQIEATEDFAELRQGPLEPAPSITSRAPNEELPQ